MPPSSHMQPRSSTRMPPPPASGGGAPGDKPLLHVGPWQEYALSALLARMRAQSMEEVLSTFSLAGRSCHDSQRFIAAVGWWLDQWPCGRLIEKQQRYRLEK